MPHNLDGLSDILFKSRRRSDFRVLVISNCQSQYIAPLLEMALDDCSCDFIVCYKMASRGQHAAVERYLEATTSTYDLVVSLVLGTDWGPLERASLTARFGRDRLFFILNLYLDALFPDMTGLGKGKDQVFGPMGGPHSKIGLGGWLAGLDARAIDSLFTPAGMHAAGYFDGYEASEKELTHREAVCDTGNFTAKLIAFSKHSFSFYTVNHPTPNMLAVFVTHVRECLTRNGQARSSSMPMNAVMASETMVTAGVWPVYPELREIVSQHYPVSTCFILPRTGEVIRRGAFIERSIAIYERIGRDVIGAMPQAAASLASVQSMR